VYQRNTEPQKSNVFRNFRTLDGFSYIGRRNEADRDFLFSAGTRSSATEDVVQGDRAGAEEDQGKSQRGCGQGELESVIARQTIVQVHLPDCDAEVDADGESRDPGKESRQDAQAAQEFREGRNVAHPVGQTETRDEVGVLMQTAENIVIAVDHHDRAQGKTHDKKRKGLQAFRVAQKASGKDTRLPQRLQQSLQQRLQQKRGAA
jgi:hypothetical protein